MNFQFTFTEDTIGFHAWFQHSNLHLYIWKLPYTLVVVHDIKGLYISNLLLHYRNKYTERKCLVVIHQVPLNYRWQHLSRSVCFDLLILFEKLHRLYILKARRE